MSCFNECQTYCLPLRFFSNYQIDYNKTELCGNIFVAKSEALTQLGPELFVLMKYKYSICKNGLFFLQQKTYSVHLTQNNVYAKGIEFKVKIKAFPILGFNI